MKREATTWMGVLAGAGLALGLGLAGPGTAGAEEVEVASTVSYDSFAQAHPYQKSVISHAGAIAAGSIAEAQADLEQRQYPRARRQTARALEALLLVRDASPSLRLADGIGGLHDKLVSDEGGNPNDLTPIYGELDAYEQVTKATDVREQIERAKAHLGAGRVKEAAVALEDAQSKIVYVETDIPVKETLVKLNRALADLTQRDWIAAKATLKDAEAGLRTFTEMASIEVDEEVAAVGAGPE